MLFQYLHKMRCKITKKNSYMQEQNACHVIFSDILAENLNNRVYFGLISRKGALRMRHVVNSYTIPMRLILIIVHFCKDTKKSHICGYMRDSL